MASGAAHRRRWRDARARADLARMAPQGWPQGRRVGRGVAPGSSRERAVLSRGRQRGGPPA